MDLTLGLVGLVMMCAATLFLGFTSSVLFRVTVFTLFLHYFWTWEQVDRWGMGPPSIRKPPDSPATFLYDDWDE